jgi:hypothetical protein
MEPSHSWERERECALTSPHHFLPFSLFWKHVWGFEYTLSNLPPNPMMCTDMVTSDHMETTRATGWKGGKNFLTTFEKFPKHVARSCYEQWPKICLILGMCCRSFPTKGWDNSNIQPSIWKWNGTILNMMWAILLGSKGMLLCLMNEEPCKGTWVKMLDLYKKKCVQKMPSFELLKDAS